MRTVSHGGTVWLYCTVKLIYWIISNTCIFDLNLSDQSDLISFKVIFFLNSSCICCYNMLKLSQLVNLTSSGNCSETQQCGWRKLNCLCAHKEWVSICCVFFLEKNCGGVQE